MNKEFNSETKQIIKDMNEKYILADSVRLQIDDYRVEMNLIEKGSIRVTLDEFRQLRKDLRFATEEYSAINCEIECLKEKLEKSDSWFSLDPARCFSDSIEQYYEEINN